jgi:hypothetical protein
MVSGPTTDLSKGMDTSGGTGGGDYLPSETTTAKATTPETSATVKDTVSNFLGTLGQASTAPKFTYTEYPIGSPTQKGLGSLQPTPYTGNFYSPTFAKTPVYE